MRHKIFQTGYFGYALLALACLLTACSGGSSSEEFDSPTPNPTPNPTSENQEIKLNANVWNMMEGMRATFYDAGTITSGSFTASAYVENTTTAYINPTTVNWNSTEWQWSDGKHYWPASGSLDFFAYMPATKPSYISSITYNARSPQFFCENLPMTYNSDSPTEGQGSGLQEFVWGVTIDQNKVSQGTSGVTMTFKHPFARIYFKLAASHPNITINSITFKTLKNNGSCTFNGTTTTWTLTGATTNLVTSYSPGASFTSEAEAKSIGGPFLVIPQNWTGGIEVNATWTELDITQTVSTTIPAITWQAGYSYTYTFTINPNATIVKTDKFTEQW